MAARIDHLSVPFRGRLVRLPAPGWVATLFALRKSRTDLASLDDARLRDIGVTRQEADRESRRPAWDVPANWRV